MKKVGEFHGIEVQSSPAVPENEFYMLGNFEPRPFQKEVLDKITKSGAPLPSLHWGRQRFVGVDLGQKDGDKSVMVHGVPDGKGGFSIIAIDEFADFPSYKWWRNPIKWWELRKIMKIVERNMKR